MIIVDDFYSNPQEVRDFALKAKYSSAGSEDNFPGSQSLMPFYNQAIINNFEPIIGCEIIVDLESHLFGQFRLSLANSSRKTIVHLDDTQWAAVIYLTLCDYRQGGTHLFQHLHRSRLNLRTTT